MKHTKAFLFAGFAFAVAGLLSSPVTVLGAPTCRDAAGNVLLTPDSRCMSAAEAQQGHNADGQRAAGQAAAIKQQARDARIAAQKAKQRKAARATASKITSGTFRAQPAAVEVPTSDPAPVSIPNDAVSTASPAGARVAAIPKSQPEGDVQIVTYLDNPKTKDATDRRIGGIKVTLKKINGSSNCATHKSGTGKTNGVAKSKDGNLVKGTINFIGCDTGEYTVTFGGRTGYKLRDGSKETKTITIEDDKTTEVKFVVVKASRTVSTGVNASQ